MVGNTGGHLDWGESWKTAQVAIGDVAMLNVVDVVSNEIVPPIVEDQSESAAGMVSGCEIAGPRIETKIHFAQGRYHARMTRRFDISAVASIQAVNSIVEPPTETIQVAIGHRQREPTEDNLPHVGFAIAVGVFEKY